NVRSYADRPVPADDLDKILEAARRTPSGSNQQRWDLVVCTERTTLERLADVWQGAKHVATSAATIALVAPKVEDRLLPQSLRPISVQERDTLEYDLGQVTMSIML